MRHESICTKWRATENEVKKGKKEPQSGERLLFFLDREKLKNAFKARLKPTGTEL
jgi:hypothetical protein